MKESYKLFASKRFLPLFITQFFGAFNDNAFKNAFLIWFTYDIAEKSSIDPKLMVTVAAAIFILPFFLFSATAGKLTDKIEKSFLTRRIKIAEVTLMILCGLFFYLESPLGLLVILFFMGVQSTFFGPIKYSLLPEHLKKQELVAGNAFVEGGTFLSILLGTIFGGLVIRTDNGVEWLSFFLIVFSIFGLLSSYKIPKSKTGKKDLKISFNIFSETKQVIDIAKANENVWISIIGISWFWLIGATFLTQFPAYTKIVIGGNEQIVTLFLTVFSLGIGFGSVMCSKMLKGQISSKFLTLGSVGITLSSLAFAYLSYFYNNHYMPQEASIINLSEFFDIGGYYSVFIPLSLFILSLFAGIYIVPLYAIMQFYSGSSTIARVVAANNILNAFFMVISSIVIIILYSLNFGVISVFVGLAVMNIFVYLLLKAKLSV